jgi:hypothetical protein
MSITEQNSDSTLHGVSVLLPTTELKSLPTCDNIKPFIGEDGFVDIQKFSNNFYKKFYSFLIRKALPCSKIFPFWEKSGYTQMITAVIIYEQSVMADWFTTLSNKKRIKIPKTFDAFHTIECDTLPGERIKSATLYIQAANGEKFKYFPIKTIENINGPFSFFDEPINIDTIFNYSIGFIYENIKYEREIKLKIEMYILTIEERKKRCFC